jgi:hypothetical protein
MGLKKSINHLESILFAGNVSEGNKILFSAGGS